MDRLVAVCTLFAVAAIGWARLLRLYRDLLADGEFTNEYLKRFIEYVSGGGRNEEIYVALVSDSVKMQRLLGPFGLIDWKPPFVNLIHHDYAIMLNLLPELHREMNHHRLTGGFANEPAIQQYAQLIRDSIVRYIGTLDDKNDQLRHDLRNPLAWYREGIQILVLSPLLLLGGMGVIASWRIWWLARHPLVSLMVGIVALIGLVSSAVTITLGWPQFFKIVQDATRSWW